MSDAGLAARIGELMPRARRDLAELERIALAEALFLRRYSAGG